MSKEINIFWFRRDLRLDDNVGFYRALQGSVPVMPIFIFDTEILESLPKDDARVSFIYENLQKMRKKLQDNWGSSLAIYHGRPKEIFQKLIEENKVQKVFTNRDYEPYAEQRDENIQKLLEKNNVAFETFKDQVIFEKGEVVKGDGKPYLVYTPFMRKWKKVYEADYDLKIYYTNDYLDNLVKNKGLPNLSLDDIGFEKSSIKVADYDVSPTLVEDYEKTRNIPAIDGTSRLGPHLRFGTVSPRKMLKKGLQADDDTFMNELIWREFFMQILYHFPKTLTDEFKPKYDTINWRNDEDEFEKWKTGTTGYPIVDAGMRQLNKTGYMHNRVRMIVGSFLCKHLLIDWRWGEAYFAEKLLDYEMSSNVGNWQWIAGTGVDAVPYFRIFNPITQLDKFDKNRNYVEEYVPEFGTDDYPEKMVEHKMARERCLETYKAAVKKS
jgi:deoxyribodipyrimidine photo-lyase